MPGENIPIKVPVYPAPNEAEANLYIYSKHNAPNFELRLKPLQQSGLSGN